MEKDRREESGKVKKPIVVDKAVRIKTGDETKNSAQSHGERSHDPTRSQNIKHSSGSSVISIASTVEHKYPRRSRSNRSVPSRSQAESRARTVARRRRKKKMKIAFLLILAGALIGVGVWASISLRKDGKDSNFNTNISIDLNSGKDSDKTNNDEASTSNTPFEYNGDAPNFNYTEGSESFEVIPGVNSGGPKDNPFDSTTDVSSNIVSGTSTGISGNQITSSLSSPSVSSSSLSPAATPTPYYNDDYYYYFDGNVTNAPTQCWSWRVSGNKIIGEKPEEQTGSSVSLSFTGRELAVGGMDLVRTFSSESTGSLWEMTQEANADYKDVVVAISGNGLRLLIGSPLTDNNVHPEGIAGDGEVRAFQYSTTIKWFPMGQVLYGNEFDKMFGNALDINYVGSRIVVGSASSVRVYQLTQEVTGNGLAARWDNIRHIIKIIPDNIFGSVVAISAMGNRIAVGEPANDFDERGAVSVFDLEPYKLSLKLEGNRYEDRFGKSVALSADGNRMVVGAYWGDYVQAYEYVPHEESWSLMGFRIYGDDSDSFGRVVDMSNDGLRIAVGAPNDSTGGESRGTTRVYQYIDGDWEQLGQDIYGENAYDYAGWSVSLSGDGRKVAVGADFHSNPKGGYKCGQVRVFEFYCIATGNL